MSENALVRAVTPPAGLRMMPPGSEHASYRWPSEDASAKRNRNEESESPEYQEKEATHTNLMSIKRHARTVVALWKESKSADTDKRSAEAFSLQAEGVIDRMKAKNNRIQPASLRWPRIESTASSMSFIRNSRLPATRLPAEAEWTDQMNQFDRMERFISVVETINGYRKNCRTEMGQLDARLKPKISSAKSEAEYNPLRQRYDTEKQWFETKCQWYISDACLSADKGSSMLDPPYPYQIFRDQQEQGLTMKEVNHILYAADELDERTFTYPNYTSEWDDSILDPEDARRECARMSSDPEVQWRKFTEWQEERVLKWYKTSRQSMVENAGDSADSEDSEDAEDMQID